MRALLTTIWLLALLLGLFCAGIFLQGLIRDQRSGDPDVSLDLGKLSSGSRSFRVWRQGGWHDLAVSSVNHAPPFGTVFAGRLSIQIMTSGRELIARTLDSSRAHTRPSNMSWTPIDSIYLERSLRQLVLAARVITPDGRFSGVQTRVHLRRRQYDPGMGGMANYVMIAPAILSLVIALGIAANMKGRGWGAGPFRSTLALVVALAAMVLVLRS